MYLTMIGTGGQIENLMLLKSFCSAVLFFGGYEEFTLF